MNPFRYSGPVTADDLIDRDAETAQLIETAAEGNNSRLVAPRRYGKTSLLGRVLHEADNRGWVGVYVDFFGVVTLADVAERIERAYGEALKGPAARWFDGLRRALRPVLRVGVPGVAGVRVDAEVHGDPAQGPGSAAGSLLERLALPRKVAERMDTRVLVVFDEFQGVLTAQSTADAIIRSEIQHHADAASYIFAGSHVGMMESLFTDRHRAFYAQARPVELPPLPPVETADFITRRFGETDRDVGAALGPLLDTAAGHPQRTMLLAHHVWDATPEDGPADEATFMSALSTATAELLGEFTAMWTALPTNQRRLVTVIATDTERPYARGGSAGGSRGGAVRASLAALLERGEIVKDPSTTSGYRVIDPLFGLWLRSGRPDNLV